jgi:phage-related protein
LHWVDRNQGVFELDTAENSYRLGAKKSTSGSATPLSFEDVASLRLCFPEPPRFVARVLQAFADAPLTKELPNALAAGIRRDVLLRTPIAADVGQRAQLEAARLRARAPGIEVKYKRCPDTLTPPLGFIEVADGFSQRIYAAGTTYRATRLRATAWHKPDVPIEPEETSAVYEIELTLDAEDKLDPVAALPAFRDARRTLRVEGKIVSAGQSGQRSWAAIENEDNSLWMYKVFIPLFNKEVPAPFAPNFATGHFFFPAYKDQRVLVDLEFDRAFITGFLDWADEGRLPSDGQGNQIVLGFQSSNGTVIQHDYQDAIPVLNVQRKASIETTTLTLGDGKLHIGLEQSSAVPTTIPLYDVSPQVEAAKDAVVGEVGGSVTVVTTQFQTAVSQVSGSIEETSAAVQTEISAAERKLTAQLDAAQNELQGLLADASAAGASLQLGGQRCKARLQTALQSLDTLRAPLLTLQARLKLFEQKVSLQIKAVEKDIAELPAVLAAPFETALVRATAVRERAKNRFASLEAAIGSLSPDALTDLTRFRQEVQGLDSDIGQVRSGLEAKVSTFVGTATGQWTELDAALARARAACNQNLQRATTQLSQDLSRLSSQVQTKLRAAPPAARASLDALAKRVDAVQKSLAPSLDRERTRLDGVLQQATTRVAQGRTQLTAAATTGSDSVKSGIAAASGVTRQVFLGIDTLQTTLEATAKATVERLQAALRTLEQTVMTALDAVPAAIKTAKTTLQTAVQTAVDTCRAGLSAFDRLLSDIHSAVAVPLTAALAALDAAEQVAGTSIETAGNTVDSTLGTAQRTIDGLVATFQSLVDGAGTALTAVRGLVAGASAQIMPPIDALVSLVEQLQSTFQTGVNLLTAFVDKAHAVLEAIPAASLPKAAVQPAITAISSALDAVMPVIQTAAQTAGDSLANLGTTLASQVQTAETTALTAVSTLVDTLTQQIDAILPAVREQLVTVQTSIDSAIEEVLTQVDQATTLAVDGITQSLTAAGTQAQAVVDAASTQLDSAESQLDQAVTTARTQLSTQRDALMARAQELLKQIADKVDQAQTQLDQRAQQLEAEVGSARDSLKTQLAAGLDALKPRLDALRTQLAQLPDSLDQRLSALADQNRALIAELTRLVPSDADIAAGVSAAVQPLTAATASIAQELSVR